MNCREEEFDLDGHTLRRFVFCPEKDQPIRAAAMHFHGQGDFAERYGEVLEPFTSRGIACVATDLPGHGRSQGVRGRVPGFEIVDRIADRNRERCRELCPEEQGPLGLLGHSAGGLMALRELLRRPERYDFSWISSPLLQPEVNQHPLLVKLAPLGARFLPGLTVGTGVTQEQCTDQPDPLREAFEDPELFHARVSLGWGYALMEAARWVRGSLRSDPPSLPLLITQGLRDPVCPPEFLHAVLQDAVIPRLTLREFSEALHEPFADAGRDEVFAAIAAWLAAEELP